MKYCCHSLLANAIEAILVLAWHNGKDALNRSENVYTQLKTIEAMPLAYES